MVWAIKKFCPYIEGTHFKVITDHHSLKWLMNIKDPCARLCRWSLKLMQYDFEIIHRKGASHVVPDALSRIDQDCVAGIEEITDAWYIKRITDVQKWPDKFRNWQIENGLLYIHKEDHLLDPVTNREYAWKLVVPKD